MQCTSSVAPWHVCYNPIKLQIDRLHPSKKRTPSIKHFGLKPILYSVTAINSCSQEREKKNNDTSSHKSQNHAFLNQLYYSIYVDNTATRTQRITNEVGEEERETKVILTNMWWADLKAALGQRINLEGLVCSVSVISKNRHLALPHVSVPDIRFIDWAALKRGGFQGVVFDKDNTITVPYSLNLWGPLGSSLESCKSVFGDNIAVFSNSAGLHEYDPDGRKARALEFMSGIKVIRHRVKKPAGSAEEIERHFGCESSRLLMVGDRPFTDIVYGNQNGFLTILTEPLSLAEEPFIVKQVRILELALINRWSKRGFKPSSHRLFLDDLHYVKDLPPL